MDQVDPLRHRAPSESPSRHVWPIATTGVALVSLLLFVAALALNFQDSKKSLMLMAAIAMAFCIFSFVLAKVFLRLRQDQRRSTNFVQTAEREFLQMANNIQEIFWMIDAQTMKALYVNQAYETITGRSRQSLVDDPSSYEEVIHPEDRIRVIAKLKDALQNGEFDQRFRIVRPAGELCWVWARGSPIRDGEGRIRRLIGTVLEITAQKEAEEQVATNLALAQASWAEADALRKATLSLTQDLRMDFVLDALLQSLADLVPYTCARVLIPEGGPHVLSLGEKLSVGTSKVGSKFPLTLNTDDSPFLRRILVGQKSFLISDTQREDQWQSFKGHEQLRSWLSVPLVASGRYLGFLSVGHSEPDHFTQEHLRHTQLLAIPAAAAIQNTRLYELAQIYGAELENRLVDLRKTQEALGQSEERRRVSEEKFQRVFRSSPVAFSISTLSEGRYMAVNEAFEQRYGYSQAELIGHTAQDLNIWENPSDRKRFIEQLEGRRVVRNFVARFRTKSGKLILTVFSADTLQFDGQACLFAVSEDVPKLDQGSSTLQILKESPSRHNASTPKAE